MKRTCHICGTSEKHCARYFERYSPDPDIYTVLCDDCADRFIKESFTYETIIDFADRVKGV